MNSADEQLYQILVNQTFGGGGGTGGQLHRPQVDESGAGLAKRFQRVVHPKAIYRRSILPGPHHQRREITITRQVAKATAPATKQQVHHIDRQLHVGGVLAPGHIKLLR
jgi:hypothetical protein